MRHRSLLRDDPALSYVHARFDAHGAVLEEPWGWRVGGGRPGRKRAGMREVGAGASVDAREALRSQWLEAPLKPYNNPR